MKNKINNIEIFSIFLLSYVSSSIGLSLFLAIKKANIDAYIGIFIGTIIGIIPLLIFLYIFNYQKDKPIYDKITNLFGKIMGNIINILLTILFFVVASTILYNISNFIVSQYLVDTPLIYILVISSLIIIYILTKEIEVIARISSIFMVIFISFFIFGFSTLKSSLLIDNIKPILEFGLKKPLIVGLINSLITTIPTFAILIIPKKNINNDEKTEKYLIISYVISSIILVSISFAACSVLGKYLIGLYQYPGYIALKRISIFKFIDRIENFLSLHWILSSFIAVIMCIYYVKDNIKRKKNSTILNTIILLVITILSYKLFRNNTQFNNYIYYIYPYILLAIFIIFVIITLRILLKKKK